MASPTKSAEQPLPLTMCSKMPFKIVRRAFMMYLRDHEVTLYHYVHSFSQDGIMEDHFMLVRALRDSLRQFPFEIVYHVRQSLQDLSVDDDAFDVPPMFSSLLASSSGTSMDAIAF